MSFKNRVFLLREAECAPYGIVGGLWSVHKWFKGILVGIQVPKRGTLGGSLRPLADPVVPEKTCAAVGAGRQCGMLQVKHNGNVKKAKYSCH